VNARAEEAERRFRELLESAALPPPDEVRHEDDSLRAIWHDRKVVVEVELRTLEAPVAA
jgi:hypothetical protein